MVEHISENHFSQIIKFLFEGFVKTFGHIAETTLVPNSAFCPEIKDINEMDTATLKKKMFCYKKRDKGPKE